jgi:hypothetical protein
MFTLQNKHDIIIIVRKINLEVMIMINNIINSFKHIPYTWGHKKAYLQVEKQLLKKNTLTGYLHDFDKILLYIFCSFLGTKRINKIHRFFSSHHANSIRKHNYTAMIIDWECARITKADKPLNARDTLVKFYPHLTLEVLPVIKKLGL